MFVRSATELFRLMWASTLFSPGLTIEWTGQTSTPGKCCQLFTALILLANLKIIKLNVPITEAQLRTWMLCSSTTFGPPTSTSTTRGQAKTISATFTSFEGAWASTRESTERIVAAENRRFHPGDLKSLEKCVSLLGDDCHGDGAVHDLPHGRGRLPLWLSHL